jgi:hypothetical protein
MCGGATMHTCEQCGIQVVLRFQYLQILKNQSNNNNINRAVCRNILRRDTSSLDEVIGVAKGGVRVSIRICMRIRTFEYQSVKVANQI